MVTAGLSRHGKKMLLGDADLDPQRRMLEVQLACIEVGIRPRRRWTFAFTFGGLQCFNAIRCRKRNLAIFDGFHLKQN
jgi:hypothetical protein